VIATAARFSAGTGSLAGSRANAAQRAAMSSLVERSNGLLIPLDYNTSAFDEMPSKHGCPAGDRTGRHD